MEGQVPGSAVVPYAESGVAAGDGHRAAATTCHGARDLAGRENTPLILRGAFGLLYRVAYGDGSDGAEVAAKVARVVEGCGGVDAGWPAVGNAVGDAPGDDVFPGYIAQEPEWVLKPQVGERHEGDCSRGIFHDSTAERLRVWVERQR